MRAQGQRHELSLCHALLLGLWVVVCAVSPAWGEPPFGQLNDMCEDGVGGYGEPAITGPEAIGWWRGEWDAVKVMSPALPSAQLSKICVCLNSTEEEPTEYQFNLVAFAADGPDGKPGTQLLSVPGRAVIDRYTHNYFGFDLQGAGPIASSPIYVGVHSVTNGPTDPRALFLCQFPRGTGVAPTYYRLPEWSGATWNPFNYNPEDTYQLGIRASFAQQVGDPPSRCSSSATTGCLAGGRFRVEGSYSTGPGQSGAARVGTLGAETAYLTFFREGNVEALAKVLNGCAINGHYWVFLAGLTNLQVEVRIADTETGQSKTYTAPRGIAFLPVQDTRALPCD